MSVGLTQLQPQSMAASQGRLGPSAAGRSLGGGLPATAAMGLRGLSLRGQASAGQASLAQASMAQAGTATSDPASQVLSPRLQTAAHQFEAAMMQQLLGPLTQQLEGMDGLGEDEDDGGSNQALTSFASEALGEALSLHGGFGIADSVLKKLKAEVAERHSGAEATGRVSGLGQRKGRTAAVGKQNRISGKSPLE